MRIARLRFSHAWQASTTRAAPGRGVGLVLDLLATRAGEWLRPRLRAAPQQRRQPPHASATPRKGQRGRANTGSKPPSALAQASRRDPANHFQSEHQSPAAAVDRVELVRTGSLGYRDRSRGPSESPWAVTGRAPDREDHVVRLAPECANSRARTGYAFPRSFRFLNSRQAGVSCVVEQVRSAREVARDCEHAAVVICAERESKFVVDVGDVLHDGFLGDDEAACDRGVASTFGDQR